MTQKIRLSESQKKVIKAMRDGAQIHRIRGIFPRAFIDDTMKYIRLATIDYLVGVSVIEKYAESNAGCTYRLTTLGLNISLD